MKSGWDDCAPRAVVPFRVSGRFVASVRVARIADGEEYDLDPVATEDVLRSVLGQQGAQVVSGESRLRTVMALLDALAESELSTEADVDGLLAEARELADRWLTQTTPRG
jgi:hypothetical protein